jgi:hypothetical protein
MAVERFTIATTDAVNSDVISGTSYSRKPYPRRVTGLGLAGSTAPQDYGVELRVEGVDMGTYYNIVGGASTSPNRDSTYALNVPIPANYLLEIILLAAPATNAGVGIISFSP